MPYATGRRHFDADSHIMEMPDFLAPYVDPDLRNDMPEIDFSASSGRKRVYELAAAGGHSPEHVSKILDMGDELIRGPKDYEGLGAFDIDERRRALDHLGFDRQLVFPTFSQGVSFRTDLDPRVQYGAARAHNRAMAAFCGADPRLLGVAALPLDHPELALAEIETLAELGLGAAWVPHRAPSRSPSHVDLDPVWASLADHKIPFVLHVGGGRLQISRVWMDTGRPMPRDWVGGGENVRGLDMLALHHDVEKFLGSMVLGGVFDRHPKLRGAAVELGAGWVPGFVQRLDEITLTFGRNEAEIKALSRAPSETVRECLGFTPFVFEDVGKMIDATNDDLYLFSSDYPHAEGGRDPLGRFERSLGERTDAALERFYSGNFARLFNVPVTATA